MSRRRKKGGRPPQPQPHLKEPVRMAFVFKNLPQDGNLSLMGAQIAWLIENGYEFNFAANDDRGHYQTVAEFVEFEKSSHPEHWLKSWIDEADVARCVENNFMISVRCHPRGSVSFYSMHGSNAATLVQHLYDAVKAELDPRPNEWRASA